MSEHSPIRLAFDVSALNHQPAGIGIYALNLAQALEKLDGSLACTLLSHYSLQRYPGLRDLRYNQRLHFPIRALWMQLLLPRLLQDIQPDLCHFTNSLAPLWTPYPYAVTIHDMSLSRLPSFHKFPKRYYSRALIPRVARRASRVLTVSEYSRSEIQRILGIPKRRITVIPLAAEPRFRPVTSAAALQRLQAHYGIEKPYLIFVGTLEPRKNLCRLLEAYARLVTSGKDGGCRLYLAGQAGWPAWAGRQIGAQIERLELQERVRHIGYVAREDLPALLSFAEAAVYPSLLEGFGLPVLEAMACGTPVLTATGSSLEEIAGDAAVYVDPWSVDSIHAGLEALFSDPEFRGDLGRRGLRRAAQFTWENTARKTLEVYRQILSDQDAGPSRSEFRLTVELDPPVNPYGSGPLEINGAIADTKELAILKTVVYAALFDYPLTVAEIAARLFDTSLEPEEVALILESSSFLKARVQKTGDYFHLKGSSHLAELRAQRQAFTLELLRRERWMLERLCRMSWVRMVALSGATAHANMDRSGDLDLFVVVKERRLWTLFLMINLLAKLLGKRRTLCVNYLVGSGSLELEHRDFFSAEQLLSLQPLSGPEFHLALLRCNPWIFEYFPNQRHKLQDPPAPPARQGRPQGIRKYNGWLDILENLILRLYGSYLLRKSRTSKADIDLSPHHIKVHLQSHKEDVGVRFRQLLDRELGL